MNRVTTQVACMEEKKALTDGSFENFESLISENVVYVDKTSSICQLAKGRGSYLLTRPRRMGKSTMISTLDYLFSRGNANTEGLACHEEWPDEMCYFVFRFAWNEKSITSYHSFEIYAKSLLQNYADFFGITLHKDCDLAESFKLLITQSLIKLKDQEFLSNHTELNKGNNPLCTDKVVLLIDEYDAPLTQNLDNSEVFNDLRRVYKDFFSVVKNIDFRFVFITGVSSYAQTSLFSGANQFVNISLDERYATCCGYTKNEIEKYFATWLDNAQEILGLSREQLIARLSYHYDGYLFTKNTCHENRVFSPVSVSLFLSKPEEGFENYWSNTGSNATLLKELLKLCNFSVTTDLLKRLYQTDQDATCENSTRLLRYIESWFPVFSLPISSQEAHHDNGHLIEVKFNNLRVGIDDPHNLTSDNAILLLFQLGYLTIKALRGKYAMLCFANYEVADTLAEKLIQTIIDKESDPYGVGAALKNYYEDADDIFEDLHQGGEALAELINSSFNKFSWELFDKNNKENVVRDAIFCGFQLSGIAVQREVKYQFGQADLVVYKPRYATDALIEDVIFEFKLARDIKDIDMLIRQGSKQIIDKKYGLNTQNRHLVCYCVVVCNQIRGVGAISKINDVNGYNIVYKSPRV